MSSTKHTHARRIRAAAITVGIVLGMTAGAFSSQAHASTIHRKAKTAKTSELANKFAALPEATAEQMTAAARVLIGRYECEFGKTLVIDRNDTNRGYFNLREGKQSWVVKPVLSSTGAVRLEDMKDSILLIQILTKSMLMNVKTSHRLVDGCVHEVQRAAEAELQKHPQTSVFDSAQGAQAATH
ncbi:MAG: hypothetical protein KGL90_02800 [Burkholderiales bacterium]|nr:hypothetical protein [Burkholderiales bacterium]